MPTLHYPDPPSLQCLTPKDARFCLATERFCTHELRVALHGTSLLVAFSGGADSLALFYALHALAPRLGLRLGMAILDHGLRESSEEEVCYANRLADQAGVSFHTGIHDVAALASTRKIGLEEAGREARQAFLETVRAAFQYDWIVTGHQLNDLAEDSLMRLLRGSGWPALAGMAGVVPERHVLRPLLLTPRTGIEGFLRSLGAVWIDDPMNKDTHYLRNRVRHELLPFFVRENPAFLANVAFRWRMARLDSLFYSDQLALYPPTLDEKGVFLERDMLFSLASALRVRYIKSVLDALGPGQVRADTLLTLHAAWERGEGEKELRFPGGKSARIMKGGIFFTTKKSGT